MRRTCGSQGRGLPLGRVSLKQLSSLAPPEQSDVNVKSLSRGIAGQRDHSVVRDFAQGMQPMGQMPELPSSVMMTFESAV